MELTTEQKQFIGDLCEKAATLSESVTSPSHLISWDIDWYFNISITLYDTSGSTFIRLAGDRLPIFNAHNEPNKEKIARAMGEVHKYYQLVMENRGESRRARIAELEKELAILREEEV